MKSFFLLTLSFFKKETRLYNSDSLKHKAKKPFLLCKNDYSCILDSNQTVF